MASTFTTLDLVLLGCWISVVAVVAVLLGLYRTTSRRQRYTWKALQSITQTTRNLVIVTDTHGRITWVNQAFTTITGYSLHEVEGRKPGDFLQCELTSPETVAAMRQARLQRRSFQGEIVNRAKSGQLYWLSVDIQPCFDERGTLFGFTSIQQVISDQKALEAELRNANASLKSAQAQADAANQSKTEFLANMSHEIRTPMTAILGYADILSEAQASSGPLRELQVSTAIATIKRAGEHLLAIINDILDVSKIEAGKMMIEKMPVDTIGFIDGVVQTMKHKAVSKGLTLDVHFATPIPKSIETDPTRLRQILVNLIGNAIKFTEQGGVTITFRQENDRPELLYVDVQDSGIGLNSEQVERLFRPFEQADTSTSRRFGGTGLGLRISKQLAGLLGGDVTADCQLDRGCRFTVSSHIGHPQAGSFLMQYETPPATGSPPEPFQINTTAQSETQALEQNSGLLQGLRVLVAEDGPDNQRLITHFLAKANAHVRVVENGKLAVEAMTDSGALDGHLKREIEFDLVLMDVQMPEMDGITATQSLRQKGCTIPIIALTAHAMSDNLQRCLTSGCNFALTKPINRAELLQVCATAHQQHRKILAMGFEAQSVLDCMPLHLRLGSEAISQKC